MLVVKITHINLVINRDIATLLCTEVSDTVVQCSECGELSLDVLHEEPRGQKERNTEEKYDAKCIKLNNNQLEDVTGLMSVLEEIILQPASITWIDMSFNKLQKIDPVCEMYHSV